MVALIIGMLVCLGLAIAVVGLVAVPARREGRDLLTPRGEEVLGSFSRDRAPDDGAPEDRAPDDGAPEDRGEAANGTTDADRSARSA